MKIYIVATRHEQIFAYIPPWVHKQSNEVIMGRFYGSDIGVYLVNVFHILCENRTYTLLRKQWGKAKLYKSLT